MKRRRSRSKSRSKSKTSPKSPKKNKSKSKSPSRKRQKLDKVSPIVQARVAGTFPAAAGAGLYVLAPGPSDVKSPSKARGRSRTGSESGDVVLPDANNRTECLDKHGYILEDEERIGEGSEGAVYAVCRLQNDKDKQDCKYAVKIRDITYTSEGELAVKEYQFLKLLQDAKYPVAKDDQLKSMVPRVYDHFQCWMGLEHGSYDHEDYLVMEKFDGDLDSKSEERVNSIDRFRGLHEGITRNIYVFTYNELVDMFRIAVNLGKLGVMHGDLKPNQFLYKGKDIRQVDSICVSDFGFSSYSLTLKQYPPTWGYPQRFGCPKSNLKAPQTAFAFINYAVDSNAWSLEHFLARTHVTFIVKYGATGRDIVSLRRFLGLQDPKYSFAIRDIYQDCLGFGGNDPPARLPWSHIFKIE